MTTAAYATGNPDDERVTATARVGALNLRAVWWVPTAHHDGVMGGVAFLQRRQCIGGVKPLKVQRRTTNRQYQCIGRLTFAQDEHAVLW